MGGRMITASDSDRAAVEPAISAKPQYAPKAPLTGPLTVEITPKFRMQ